ncbi:WG repeat-containing protein [Rhodothermus marinus]|uniref:WG repeat-containing protein n=1 Tax=Rhodothermus marinus TaxID=29549 RepID=UPI000A772E4E|nr:WG repeat-containing protein [Rhodothermus marinus]
MMRVAIAFLSLLFVAGTALAQTEALLPVATTAGYGFVTLEGQTAIAPRFERVLAFSEGRAAARLDGQWGFIDTTGHWVVPPQYEQVFAYQNGYAACAKTAAGALSIGRGAR